MIVVSIIVFVMVLMAGIIIYGIFTLPDPGRDEWEAEQRRSYEDRTDEPR